LQVPGETGHCRESTRPPWWSSRAWHASFQSL
jgi:hypothetical protein